MPASDPALNTLFLALQAGGVALTATLMSVLALETRRAFARWWAVAWLLLVCGLLTLFAGAVQRAEHSPFVLLPYAAFQYAFAILLVRGLRSFVDERQTWRLEAWLALLCAAGLAAVWPLAMISPRGVYRAHALVFGALLLVAFTLAVRVRPPGPFRIGYRLTPVALAALGVHLVGFAAVEWSGHGSGLPPAARPFEPLFDLLLQTALGFGQVLIVMESVNADLVRTNQELAVARDRMEAQARVDPLTNALNRHAFHTLFDHPSPPAPSSGCAVVIDIDNLKQLNDTRGHAAGDEAIRAAAARIRHAIRADDLLFRWGGDEFLALLFGMSEDATRARFSALVDRGTGEPHLSWGAAAFADHEEIAAAVEAADRSMYERRAGRRGRTSGDARAPES